MYYPIDWLSNCYFMEILQGPSLGDEVGSRESAGEGEPFSPLSPSFSMAPPIPKHLDNKELFCFYFFRTPSCFIETKGHC